MTIVFQKFNDLSQGICAAPAFQIADDRAILADVIAYLPIAADRGLTAQMQGIGNPPVDVRTGSCKAFAIGDDRLRCFVCMVQQMDEAVFLQIGVLLQGSLRLAVIRYICCQQLSTQSVVGCVFFKRAFQKKVLEAFGEQADQRIAVVSFPTTD